MVNDATKSKIEPEAIQYENKGDLLKRWLSVAESQICALEVLSSQLPMMDKLLLDSIEDLSNSFSILAKEAQNQSANIHAVISAASNVEMEGNVTSLKQILDELASIENADELRRRVTVLSEAVSKQEQIFKETVKKANVSSDQMMTGVASAIVGMQFQDRVSQNLVIASNVVDEIVSYLEGDINVTIDSLGISEDSVRGRGLGILDQEFASRLVGFLTLGELQKQFIDHLIEHHYITDSAELGFNQVELEDRSDGNDIEMF